MVGVVDTLKTIQVDVEDLQSLYKYVAFCIFMLTNGNEIMYSNEEGEPTPTY